MVVGGRGQRVGKMGEKGQKVQTSDHKTVRHGNLKLLEENKGSKLLEWIEW